MGHGGKAKRTQTNEIAEFLYGKAESSRSLSWKDALMESFNQRHEVRLLPPNLYKGTLET